MNASLSTNLPCFWIILLTRAGWRLQNLHHILVTFPPEASCSIHERSDFLDDFQETTVDTFTPTTLGDFCGGGCTLASYSVTPPPPPSTGPGSIGPPEPHLQTKASCLVASRTAFFALAALQGGHLQLCLSSSFPSHLEETTSTSFVSRYSTMTYLSMVWNNSII